MPTGSLYIFLWPFAQLCASIASSTKPEIHNVPRCHQRRTGPRSQHVQKISWSLDVWFFRDMRANKQARWSQYFASLPEGGKWSKSITEYWRPCSVSIICKTTNNETRCCCSTSSITYHDNNGLRSSARWLLASSGDSGSTGRRRRNDSRTGIYSHHIMHMLTCAKWQTVSESESVNGNLPLWLGLRRHISRIFHYTLVTRYTRRL